MQVFQTCGVPPSLGRIILPTSGWTRNRMNALTKSVTAYRYRTKGAPPRAGPARRKTEGVNQSQIGRRTGSGGKTDPRTGVVATARRKDEPAAKKAGARRAGRNLP